MELPEIILCIPVVIYFALALPLGFYLTISGLYRMWKER